jgi:hypothetical protein
VIGAVLAWWRLRAILSVAIDLNTDTQLLQIGAPAVVCVAGGLATVKISRLGYSDGARSFGPISPGLRRADRRSISWDAISSRLPNDFYHSARASRATPLLRSPFVAATRVVKENMFQRIFPPIFLMKW